MKEIEINQDKVFNIIREGIIMKIERDYCKSYVLSGWTTQQYLDNVFDKLETSCNNFGFLRTNLILNNYIRMLTYLLIIFYGIFFLNLHTNYANNTLYILVPIISILIIFKIYYYYKNVDMFIFDVILAVKLINIQYLFQKDLELHFDFRKSRLILLIKADHKEGYIKNLKDYNQIYVDKFDKKRKLKTN